MQDGFEAKNNTVGILFMSLFDPVNAVKLFFEARKLPGVYASGLRLS